MSRGGMPLGEWLASRGLITRDQLGIALTEQKKTGKLLGELFVTLGFVSAAAMREAIAEKTGTESVELPEGTADAYALAHVPRELARRFTLFPLAYDAASRTLTSQGEHPAPSAGPCMAFTPISSARCSRWSRPRCFNRCSRMPRASSPRACAPGPA